MGAYNNHSKLLREGMRMALARLRAQNTLHVCVCYTRTGCTGNVSKDRLVWVFVLFEEALLEKACTLFQVRVVSDVIISFCGSVVLFKGLL